MNDLCGMFGICLLTAEPEEMVNITPVLLRFIGKFFIIFAVVAVVTILTPWMAKKVDAFREKHEKPAVPEDPRCKAVRGPYDMPEPPEKKPVKRRPQNADGTPVKRRPQNADGTPVKRRPQSADGTPVKRRPQNADGAPVKRRLQNADGTPVKRRPQNPGNRPAKHSEQ
ncbi:MAG TPA: hypothetical protein DCG49_03145 [Ruminococcus sp.]|nr:hypothetical protein [Ruminococcus sp.]